MLSTTISTKRNVRVSKKFYSSLPAEVRTEIEGFINQFDYTKHGGLKVSTINVHEVDPLHEFRLEEGQRMLGISPDGRIASVEAVAEHNVGAAGVSHLIDKGFHMPEGCYLLTVVLAFGKYYADLYHVDSDEHKLAETINSDNGVVVIFEGRN